MKKLKREITDTEVLDGIADTDGRSGEATVRKNKSGIVVKGLHDLAVRFSRCCNPVPGDEIVGFVTRGRGVSIHRTDCINVINLPEDERGRLIDAEWQVEENPSSTEQYSTEIQIFANNRIGLFADISKVFTEKQIDITSMNVRTSKPVSYTHLDVYKRQAYSYRLGCQMSMVPCVQARSPHSRLATLS